MLASLSIMGMSNGVEREREFDIAGRAMTVLACMIITRFSRLMISFNFISQAKPGVQLVFYKFHKTVYFSLFIPKLNKIQNLC